MYHDDTLPFTAVPPLMPKMKNPIATTTKPSTNFAAIDMSRPDLPRCVYNQASTGDSSMIQIGFSAWYWPGDQVTSNSRKLWFHSTLCNANSVSEVDICE